MVALGLLHPLLLGASPLAADIFTIGIPLRRAPLTLSGTVGGCRALQPQIPAGTGLITKYSGTINASQAAGSIQFTGSSAITAQTNGTWAPLPGGSNAGTAPGDYGARATIFGTTAFAALRSVQFDATSPSITVTSGQFNPSGLTFLFVPAANSTLDYYTSITSGTLGLTGNATNNVAAAATLSTAGSTQTLTLGVANATFHFTAHLGERRHHQCGGPDRGDPQHHPAVADPNPRGDQSRGDVEDGQSTAAQSFQVISTTNFTTWQTNASGITSASTNYSYSVTNQASGAYYKDLRTKIGEDTGLAGSFSGVTSNTQPINPARAASVTGTPQPGRSRESRC